MRWLRSHQMFPRKEHLWEQRKNINIVKDGPSLHDPSIGNFFYFWITYSFSVFTLHFFVIFHSLFLTWVSFDSLPCFIFLFGLWSVISINLPVTFLSKLKIVVRVGYVFSLGGWDFTRMVPFCLIQIQSLSWIHFHCVHSNLIVRKLTPNIVNSFHACL